MNASKELMRKSEIDPSLELFKIAMDNNKSID